MEYKAQHYPSNSLLLQGLPSAGSKHTETEREKQRDTQRKSDVPEINKQPAILCKTPGTVDRMLNT